MAYGNIFPTGYQQQYFPQMQQPMQMQQAQAPAQPQQQQGGIIWVQGEAGAKSFLIAPNTTVQLWDSEAQTIYLKSADGSGMPSMKILDYTIRDNTAPQNAISNAPERPNFDSFVTKDEFHSFEEKMQRRLDKMAQKRVREDADE